jgi:hypothetical protein
MGAAMTPAEHAIFEAAMRGLASRYRAHEAERASVAQRSLAEADVCGRRMSAVADAIQGVRELRAEVEAEFAELPPVPPAPAAQTYVVKGTLGGAPKERPRPANDGGEA